MRADAVRIAERMLRSGSSCQAVAAVLQLHRSTIYRLRRAKLPRRWYRLTAAERRAIERKLLDDDLSRREIARQTGRSPSTISRVSTAMVDRGSGDRVRRVRAYRCPGCGGLVTVVPCVFCRCMTADAPASRDA